MIDPSYRRTGQSPGVQNLGRHRQHQLKGNSYQLNLPRAPKILGSALDIGMPLFYMNDESRYGGG